MVHLCFWKSSRSLYLVPPPGILFSPWGLRLCFRQTYPLGSLFPSGPSRVNQRRFSSPPPPCTAFFPFFFRLACDAHFLSSPPQTKPVRPSFPSAFEPLLHGTLFFSSFFGFLLHFDVSNFIRDIQFLSPSTRSISPPPSTVFYYENMIPPPLQVVPCIFYYFLYPSFILTSHPDFKYYFVFHFILVNVLNHFFWSPPTTLHNVLPFSNV